MSRHFSKIINSFLFAIYMDGSGTIQFVRYDIKCIEKVVGKFNVYSYYHVLFSNYIS